MEKNSVDKIVAFVANRSNELDIRMARHIFQDQFLIFYYTLAGGVRTEVTGK